MKNRLISLLLMFSLSLQSLMAMNPIIDKYSTMLQSKLLTYASLLNFRYKCLCVKTSMDALLPVEITTGEGNFDLETVAKIAILDDEHYIIIPNSPELLDAIGLAFMCHYPQLKQDLLGLDMSESDEKIREIYENAKRVYNEQTGEDMPPVKILVLTTPEINDDTKKQLETSVDALEKMCKTKFQAELSKSKTDMMKALAKDPRSVDDANRELDKVYDNCWIQVSRYTMEEKQAISEENDRFHMRELEKDKEQSSTTDLPQEDTYIFGQVTVVNSGDDQVIEAATIDADQGLYIPKNVFVQHLTFKRSFAQQVLSTFCVPFTFRSMDVPGKFYVYSSYDAEQNIVSLNPYTGLIEAGKGYFFMPDDDIEQLEFDDAMVIATPLPDIPEQVGLYGALSKVMFLEDAYLMQPSADGTPKLVKADSKATLAPFQSYLWLGVETEAPELKLSLTNTSTGIVTLDSELPKGVASIYDLRGQRIPAPRRGVVYIKQGKKYMNF